MNRRVLLGAALCLLATAPGCGIPVDDSARVVPVEVGIQYAVTPIPTTPPGVTEEVSGIVYFVGANGSLTPVDRNFKTTRSRFTDDPETEQKRAFAKGLVEQLFAGPTAAESEQGIRTYWPGDVSVLDVDLTVAGTAIVTITDESRYEVSPAIDRLGASSELVFTLTELPGIEGVRLVSPTSNLRLVTASGPAAALAPVSRGQFGDLAGLGDASGGTNSATETETGDEIGPTPTIGSPPAESPVPGSTPTPGDG